MRVSATLICLPSLTTRPIARSGPEVAGRWKSTRISAVARADPEQKLDISFTGHSLGGGLAALAARASGREAVTFNAAGLNNASMRDEQTFLDAAGIAPGTVDNYVVQGKVLTGLQGSLPIPRAFGDKHLLDLVLPEGKSPRMQNAPIIGPIRASAAP